MSKRLVLSVALLALVTWLRPTAVAAEAQLAESPPKAQEVVRATAAVQNNFFQYDGHEFHHLVGLMAFAPAGDPNPILDGRDHPNPKWYQNRLLAFPLVKIISGQNLGELTPSQLRLVWFCRYASRQVEIPFSVIRNKAVLPPGEKLAAQDTLLLRLPDIEPDSRTDDGNARSVSLFFNLVSEERIEKPQVVYGEIPEDKLVGAFTIEQYGDSTGFLDWTPETDLSWPVALIQADSTCSGQWNLWYEWTVASSIYSSFPRNVLQGLSCINFIDNPQFPELYLQYYELTGDEQVKERARRGVESILKYRVPDGLVVTNPLPWKNQVLDAKNRTSQIAPGVPVGKGVGDPGHTLHYCWRTVAKAQRFFAKSDPKFASRLEEAYRKFRNYYFAHLDSYAQSPHMMGWAVEAVKAHYELTSAPEDLRDLKKLVRLMLEKGDKPFRNIHGSYIPGYVIGLAEAYKVLHDKALLDKAEEWLMDPIYPCLWRNREYYHPDVEHDKGEMDLVSCHWNGEQFIRLFEATKDPFYLVMAGFVWGGLHVLEDRGGGLYGEYMPVPNAECIFPALRWYIYGTRYPSLYKVIQTFRMKKAQVSDWQKWPLVARAGDSFIEISQDGQHRFSPDLYQ